MGIKEWKHSGNHDILGDYTGATIGDPSSCCLLSTSVAPMTKGTRKRITSRRTSAKGTCKHADLLV